MILVHLIMELEDMLVDPTVNAHAREAVIDLLLKNLMHMDKGLPRGWSWTFVENGFINRGTFQKKDCTTQVLARYPRMLRRTLANSGGRMQYPDALPVASDCRNEGTSGHLSEPTL